MKWDRFIYKLPGGLLVLSGLLLLCAGSLLVIYSKDMSQKMIVAKKKTAPIILEYIKE